MILKLRISPTSDTLLTLVGTLALFSTLLVFNVKTLLLPFLLCFVLIFLFSSLGFLDSILFTFFIALPFENAIRQWSLYSPGLEIFNSYTFFFGVSPKIILGLLLIILFLFTKDKSPTSLSFDPTTKVLIMFFIVASLVSLSFSQRHVFILTGYARLVLALLYFFAAKHFFTRHPRLIKNFFVTITLFCVFIGGLQLIRQRQIGRYIELTPAFAREGYSTTDGVKQYRVSGFISHPVYFGSFMCLLLPIIIGIWLSDNTRRPLFHLLFISLISLTILVILGTLSRSTWINLFGIFIAYVLYLRQNPLLSNLNLKLNQKVKTILTLSLVILSIPVLLLVSTRAKSITTLFNPLGSGSTRVGINLSGLKVAATNPLRGVGLNNFAFESYQRGYSSEFSAPPHNTFIIFFSELGIPATLLFLLFIFNTMWPKTNPASWNPFTFGIWIGLGTFLLSSQIHPLFNLDPTFDLFMLTAGTFSVLWPHT